MDGACGFGSCVDGATVPLFFARADGGGDSATAKKGVSNTRPIDSTLATWYWAACIGLVLSLVVAVAAAAKRYSSEAKVVTTPIFAAACVVAGEGDSI